MRLTRTPWRAWLISAVAIALTGCASPYGGLVHEDSLPDLHAAKQATRSRGNHTIMAPTEGGAEADGSGTASTLNIAVHELEEAPTDRILVFIHGVFADHETWRFVAGDLARDHGVWLVDMPGCGSSDAPESIDDDTYTIPDVAERTLQALRYCLTTRPTSRLDLVGHSFGAAVIVRMFGDTELRSRYEDVLARVDRLVLISPLDIAMSGPAPIYREIAQASALRVQLAATSGVLRNRVAKATMASVADRSRALREEADKRVEILRDPGRRKALQTMIARAVPWTKSLRPEWSSIESIESTYAEVDRDCLILVGTRDEALPASMSYKLAVQLPRACFVPLKGVMHSPHIEAHDRCATLIREFVTTGRVDSDVLRPRQRVARPS